MKKYNYEKLAHNCFNKSKEKDVDVRDIIRKCVMNIENNEHEGWDRMKFLDECVKIKKIKTTINN